MLTPTQNLDLAMPVLASAQNLNKQLANLQTLIAKNNADKNNPPIDETQVNAAAAHILAALNILAQHIVSASATTAKP
jgi:hypothetical protein